ncbi:hypothetical protein ABT300_30245 [Streptomyces sp. NPDC001027]
MSTRYAYPPLCTCGPEPVDGGLQGVLVVEDWLGESEATALLL